MIVYRVENEEGNGMYCCGDDSLNNCKHYSDRDNSKRSSVVRPAPTDKMKSFKWIYGFESIEDVYRWLCHEQWLIYLNERGFFISEYEVKEVYIVKRQLVFNPNYMILLNKISIVKNI